MKILHRLVILCFAAGCASGAAADTSHSSLYSFSDLYRMTVNGTALDAVGATPAAAEAQQVRVATVQPAPSTDLRFTITPVPGPGRWPLLFAGLVVAAWVAHRRLTRAL
jgi:hypothetical protein